MRETFKIIIIIQQTFINPAHIKSGLSQVVLDYRQITGRQSKKTHLNNINYCILCFYYKTDILHSEKQTTMRSTYNREYTQLRLKSAQQKKPDYREMGRSSTRSNYKESIVILILYSLSLNSVPKFSCFRKPRFYENKSKLLMLRLVSRVQRI